MMSTVFGCRRSGEKLTACSLGEFDPMLCRASASSDDSRSPFLTWSRFTHYQNVSDDVIVKLHPQNWHVFVLIRVTEHQMVWIPGIWAKTGNWCQKLRLRKKAARSACLGCPRKDLHPADGLLSYHCPIHFPFSWNFNNVYFLYIRIQHRILLVTIGLLAGLIRLKESLSQFQTEQCLPMMSNNLKINYLHCQKKP